MFDLEFVLPAEYFGTGIKQNLQRPERLHPATDGSRWGVHSQTLGGASGPLRKSRRKQWRNQRG